MFDKNLPEVQAYVEEKLQKQAVAIADRILMTYPIGKTIQDIMYITGLPRKMAEAVLDKCAWKYNYKQNFPKGYVMGQVQILWNMAKNENVDAKELESFLKIDYAKAEQWKKNPDKAAITELLSHHLDVYEIMDTLSMTKEKVQELMPDCQELQKYQLVFKPIRVTDEEAEKAYQENNENQSMRQVIIMRKDLNMSAGKMAAQCCHASVAFLSRPIQNAVWVASSGAGEDIVDTLKIDIRRDIRERWRGDIFTKTVCEAKNRTQLMKAVTIAEGLRLQEGEDFFLIKDCCLTELEPEEVDENGVGRTLTCIGFRPLPDDIAHAISKKYQLYK